MKMELYIFSFEKTADAENAVAAMRKADPESYYQQNKSTVIVDWMNADTFSVVKAITALHNSKVDFVIVPTMLRG